MINYLKDIKKETLIGQLPDVINSNNESIRKEFNWIFDSSLNRLTKSVYAPTGSVKSHFGEFTNLACEYFTVKNVDSLKYSIQDSVESIINETLNVSSMQTVMAALTNIANSSFIDPSAYDISALCDISTLIVNHNVLNNRFKDTNFIDDDKQDFCHDAAAIVYKKENDKYITVKDTLDNIDTSVNALENNIVSLNKSVNDLLYTRIKLPIVQQTKSDTIIYPNVYNIWDDVNCNITISKGDVTDNKYVNEYIIKINNFTSGKIIFSTTWGTLKWANGDDPSFTANHAYEISIIDNFASYIEYYTK